MLFEACGDALERDIIAVLRSVAPEGLSNSDVHHRVKERPDAAKIYTKPFVNRHLALLARRGFVSKSKNSAVVLWSVTPQQIERWQLRQLPQLEQQQQQQSQEAIVPYRVQPVIKEKIKYDTFVLHLVYVKK
jgi:hypothetical protein